MRSASSALRHSVGPRGDKNVIRSLRNRAVWAVRGNSRGGQGGFTLLEALVVLVLIGLMVTLVGTQMSSSWQKSRLQSTADEVKSFIQGAYDETSQIHAPVFVRFTPVATGGGTLQLSRDAAGTQVVDDLQLPSFISLSTTVVGQVDGNWPAADGTALAPNAATARVLECDLVGRTMRGDGVQVTGEQQFILTHRNMVAGDLAPHFRYVVEVSPLWHVRVTREMY